MCSRKCSVCFTRSDNLIDISQVDEGTTILSKLQYLVPEINWPNDSKLCSTCVSDLKVACKFREQCLNIRVKLKEEIEMEEDAYVDYNDMKLDYGSDSEEEKFKTKDGQQYFICFHCNDRHTSKEELIEHIQNMHHNEQKDLRYKRKTMCPQCGRRFAKESSIKEHLEVCDGIRRHRKVKTQHQCHTCQKFYSTMKILKAHQKTCDESNVKKTDYQCPKCFIFYKNAKRLENHAKQGCKKEGKEPFYLCKRCEGIFNSVIDLKDHLLKIHNVVDYQCEKCDKIFETNDEYNTHKHNEHKKVSVKRTFTCQVCSTEFDLLKDLTDHCINAHSLDEKSIRPYSCELCQKRFRSSTNLVNHKLYHEGNRTHICSMCGKSFITKSDLINHEITHYDKKNYGCDKCGKAFKTRNNLCTHYLIVHTDPLLWRFVCKVCGKRSPLKSNHDQHTRRHTGEKNFVCSLCKKQFASKREMQVHILCHSNVKKHKCDQCGKEYRKKHTLDIHLKKSHGIGNAKIPVRVRKHACHICSARFYDKIKLARHLCTHSGLKPFTCYACEKKFTDKSYLKHHLKTAHNIYEDPMNSVGSMMILHKVEDMPVS
ncbi:unnamed protein product [Phyllotreta striolata]|uniref:Zinc finger protein 865 n=1 Tax=Phyllotreta striolata TaxID=444603 RepID=A0A9N9XQL3_PHYSR|nr:unnamed protein product [Phyllotreta striolata]